MKYQILVLLALLPLLYGCPMAARASVLTVPEALDSPSGYGVGVAGSLGISEKGFGEVGGDVSFHMEAAFELGYRVAFASVLLRSYFDIDIGGKRGILFAPAVGVQEGRWRGGHVYGVVTRVGLNYYWAKESDRAIVSTWNSYTYVGIEPSYVFVGSESESMPLGLIFSIGILAM